MSAFLICTGIAVLIVIGLEVWDRIDEHRQKRDEPDPGAWMDSNAAMAGAMRKDDATRGMRAGKISRKRSGFAAVVHLYHVVHAVAHLTSSV